MPHSGSNELDAFRFSDQPFCHNRYVGVVEGRTVIVNVQFSETDDNGDNPLREREFDAFVVRALKEVIARTERGVSASQ
ncbi:hypothetical protein [Pinisolibacter aquiterrae]|uniref:hypothetical protein n=1 Tax=Pinisolibacter aquiterrae TaxID=2815579 RepID=UPI001C3D4251|nr:hypothetical protein [Pinisolibacter aquiterrae]MBV5266485.1 hypothetical protein [Pinisolibacter aquiterrae]MCC8234745.1 hypothetical protein [Pinisolibacter aquiterrae]